MDIEYIVMLSVSLPIGIILGIALGIEGYKYVRKMQGIDCDPYYYKNFP